ncbi:MAG: hypothetical protein JXB85_01510 [Anaerolineales bacterium]|nr:hypothetical protein [Anaerolineales bacterium]
MAEKRYLPDSSRVSVLTAMILLTYALTRVISAPIYPLRIPLAGLTLEFNLNLNTAFAILAAGLAAAGVDWLLRGHPSIRPGETVEHWLIPMLTAMVTGIALYAMPTGPVWWLGFGLGGLLLVAVFLAEYVVVDPGDTRYTAATVALTVLAFTLYLILAVALRAGGTRPLLVIPALFIAGGLTALRTLHLRLNERWEFAWAIGIALVGAQLAAGLFFWPLAPIRFGLGLLGPVYALTGMAVSLEEGTPVRRAVIEPAVMLGVIWGLAIWLG